MGQNSATLSGGESQRIKLVHELAKAPRGHTLYILDEPTIGLHRKDISLLVKVLYKLTAQGNSVIVIEHDADLISCADHIIELGPESGEKGGKIIFEGRFEKLKKAKTPWGKRCSDSE